MQTSEPGERASSFGSFGSVGSVDYAEPASLASSRSSRTRGRWGRGRPEQLWGGRGRRALQAGCAALGLLLAVVGVAAVGAQQPGAESPEAAVEQLLQGIADLDATAIVGVVAPAEVADPARVDDAYTRLDSRVRRLGEVPPAEVDRVLRAAEDQLAGSLDRGALALLAAVDLELSRLDLDVEPVTDEVARVYLRDGLLGVQVDEARLPGEAVVDGAEAAGEGSVDYVMELAQGWVRDGVPFDAYLVAVEVEGRWYVSVEESASEIQRSSS